MNDIEKKFEGIDFEQFGKACQDALRGMIADGQANGIVLYANKKLNEQIVMILTVKDMSRQRQDLVNL